MTFHPIPNTAEVDMIYLQGDQPCENRYFVAGAAPWSLAFLTTLDGVFAGWEADVAAPLRSSSTRYIKTFLRDMTAESGAELEVAHNTPGTAPGSGVPQNVTLSLKAQTGLAGRANRGRTYWIGMPFNQLDGGAGTVGGAYIAELIDAMNALVGASFPNSGHLAVVHRKAGSVYLPEGVPHEILSYTATDRFVDSQRRRLPGHNRHR